MILDNAEEELRRVGQDPSLGREPNLAPRGDALDDLGFVEEASAAYLRSHPADSRAARILEEATALRSQLESVDRRLFARLRNGIRSHEISPGALRGLFDQYTAYSPDGPAHRHLGFEPLDRLVAGLLLHDRPPDAEPLRSHEMVAYQPTPASVILEMVDRLEIDSGETFCDVGSGLGVVVLLVHLLTGCRAVGIEVDPGLCNYASRVAGSLGVQRTAFVNADARNADLSEANIVYLFTPFTGSILTDVMARLHAEATRRPIRVSTYGPITPYVATLPWLTGLNDHRRDEFRLALFRSR